MLLLIFVRSCHSNILVLMVTDISASLAKQRLHSNTQGFSSVNAGLIHETLLFGCHGNILVSMVTGTPQSFFPPDP